jgi:hypothetical protein
MLAGEGLAGRIRAGGAESKKPLYLAGSGYIISPEFA